MDTRTSHQRYLDNFYKSDLNNLVFTPHKNHSKIKRNIYRNKSVKNPFFFNDFFLSNRDETNKFNKTTKNFFKKEILNNNDDKRMEILRTTRNHKIRSLYSRYSDIFNLNNNKLLYTERKDNKTFTSILNSRDKDKKNNSKISEYLKQRKKQIDIKKYKKVKIPEKNI